MVSTSDRLEEADPHGRRDLADGARAPPTFGCAARPTARGARRSIRRRPRTAELAIARRPALARARAHARVRPKARSRSSLMPPLTEVRRLELPPLARRRAPAASRAQRGAVFRECARRRRSSAHRAAGNACAAPRRQSSRAAASARLVATIRTAAQQAGWTVESDRAGGERVGRGGTRDVAGVRRRQCGMWRLVAQTDRTDLLQFDEGRLVGVRRFRAGGGRRGDDRRHGRAVGARRSHRASLPQRRDLGAALVVAGDHADCRRPASGRAPRTARVARGAHSPAASRSGAAQRRRRRGRRAAAHHATWWLPRRAALVLVLAAGVELWGVHHQLDIVRAERARLRPQIASTLIGRTTVDATYRAISRRSTRSSATHRIGRRSSRR